MKALLDGWDGSEEAFREIVVALLASGRMTHRELAEATAAQPHSVSAWMAGHSPGPTIRDIVVDIIKRRLFP